MIENRPIPSELQSQLDGESICFFIKADKEKTTRDLWRVIRGGLFWIVVVGGIFTSMVYELVLGQPTNLNIGHNNLTVSPDDLSPLYGFFTFGAIFMLPGLVFVLLGMYGFSKEGGYFLGTPRRLLRCNSWKEYSAHHWSDFLSETNIFYTNSKGNLILTLKEKLTTKKGKKKGNKSVKMAEIDYAREINKFCLEKISHANKTFKQ
ncbi:hypothetical protein Q4603_18465 [Zobellia galactanivorans]|uniref:hypothetical protein n=1 Tax=Zobellia galactanivorans (strain DSM 12802 / CCUG 47099 / CIP 106680 / NCIMB 13871 / Dsij) TaxID=63186 RepID=UPI0026E128D6|nr:hypothetical protein [Zobellia galactanivorans]MDO6810613.1 hypothetical protein [Zobellia galactanivorans]